MDSRYVPISNLYPASYGISSATTSYYCFDCQRVSSITGDHCCYCKLCCSLLRTPTSPVQTPLPPKVDSDSLPRPSSPIEITFPKRGNDFSWGTSTTITSDELLERSQRNNPSTVPFGGGQPRWTTLEYKIPPPPASSPYNHKNVNYFMLAGDE